jgi:hypothetical protein
MGDAKMSLARDLAWQNLDLVYRSSVAVGVSEYQMTAALWARGILQDFYAVSAQEVRWFVGGQEQPGRRERLPIQLPPEIDITPVTEDTLNCHAGPSGTGRNHVSLLPARRRSSSSAGAKTFRELQGRRAKILQSNRDLSHHAHRGIPGLENIAAF